MSYEEQGDTSGAVGGEGINRQGGNWGAQRIHAFLAAAEQHTHDCGGARLASGFFCSAARGYSHEELPYCLQIFSMFVL